MVAATIAGLLKLFTGSPRFDGLLLWILGGTTGAWLVVDSAHEIATVWTVTARHGLTVADLAAIPPVLVAGAIGFRRLLSSSAHTSASAGGGRLKTSPKAAPGRDCGG